ncbi:MAG: ABC transporter substrate-binding protein [Candidatus Thorarchaeota archaeon]
MGKRWIISVLIIILLGTLSPTLDIVCATFDVPPQLNVGPYVDKVVYKVIPNGDQRVLALQAGETELDLSFIEPVHVPTLDADPDIDIYIAPRNGYGHFTINCDKYPLNISGLRRAFAYAFDKMRVTSETFDGYSIEHDSLIPPVNPWCIEDDFGWHYYTNQSAFGNQILDDLNFTIDSGSGYRLAPDGTAFSIVIEYVSPGLPIGNPVFIGVDALQSLHIDATAQAVAYNDIVPRLDQHQDFDIVFYAVNFEDFDIEWLAYDYWSNYADVPYQNPTNFRNTTYDSWRNQLLFGKTYDEVYEAASEMQKILQYNVPRLVIYVNTYIQGYRNDWFTGQVPDQSSYITGQWTLRKIHRIDGARGGTVSIAANTEPDSFNFFVSDNPTSTSIFREVWPSLYAQAPDLTPYSYLAESMLVENHEDNVQVADNHTRFTLDIIQNATWSDGTPLTAEDVAFSFNYTIESGIYGNPAALQLSDLYSVYAMTPYRVIIEFSSENYWHFSHFAYQYIIPKHIFNNATGIGYQGWNTWNPVFDPAEPHVTCGPYLVTDYDAGEFYELSANPDFAFFEPLPVTDHPVTDYPPPPPPPPPPPGPFFVLLLIEGALVIVLVFALWKNMEK